MHTAVILAAGKGTRMESELPKVIHNFKDKPLISYVLDAAHKSNFVKFIPVVGYQKELVIDVIEKWNRNLNCNIDIAYQEEQLGTGHAVQMAMPFIDNNDETVIILLGDVPLIESKTLTKAINYYEKENLDGCVLTMKVANPTGYGRIIRDENNSVSQIVEEKDTNDQQKKINEVNSGIFIFKASALHNNLNLLKNQNSQNEYYLTDMVEVFNNNNLKFGAVTFSDATQFTGINSQKQLKDLEQVVA